MIDNEFYSLAKHIYDALNADMSSKDKLIHAKPSWDKLWALKNYEGHLPNSQAVREESESIRKGLPTKALNSPEDFGEVWQKLASMYPLSKELQEKLDNVNGLLYPFWDQLQGKYRDCERNY
jgi:hypothetical protein